MKLNCGMKGNKKKKKKREEDEGAGGTIIRKYCSV
jgi:hypothetical protein